MTFHRSRLPPFGPPSTESGRCPFTPSGHMFKKARKDDTKKKLGIGSKKNQPSCFLLTSTLLDPFSSIPLLCKGIDRLPCHLSAPWTVSTTVLCCQRGPPQMWLPRETDSNSSPFGLWTMRSRALRHFIPRYLWETAKPVFKQSTEFTSPGVKMGVEANDKRTGAFKVAFKVREQDGTQHVSVRTDGTFRTNELMTAS